MNKALVRFAISQSELFKSWPDDAIAHLIRDADVLVVEQGGCIIRSGDEAQYLHLVVSGFVILSRNIPSGRSFTAGVHLAGDFHGLGPVMSQGSHIYNAVCKENTTLVRIPAKHLRDLIAASGCLALPLFTALEKRYLQALHLHASAAVNSTQARIAGLLKSIDERSVRSHASMGIKLSQDEIATMLGTRRQVVNRVLRNMVESGAIHVQYGRISIVERAKLDAMAHDSA